MKTLRVSVLLAALALPGWSAAALAQRGQPATIVTGTLLGSDGAPMKLAHVHLLDLRTMQTVARAEAEPDGRFALATVRTGVFDLEFTGVDHYSATVPLVALSHATIVVNAQLRHYAYTDSLDKVTALGDWNHFAFDHTTPLVRQSDGRYAATVTVDSSADSVAYELLGLEVSGARSINGPMADRYVYDEGGDYRSVIAAHDGKATIVLDPAQLVRQGGAGDTLAIVFGDPRSEASRVAALWGDWEAQRQHWQDSLMAGVRRREALTSVNYDLAPFIAGRTALLGHERDPLVRQLILLQVLETRDMGTAVDAGLARRMLQELPPTSPWWAVFELGGPGRIEAACALANPPRPAAAGDTTPPPADTAALRQAVRYLERVATEHPDSTVRRIAHSAATGLERVMGDARAAGQLYARLAAEHPEPPMLALERAMHSPTRVWQVGRDAPTFSFPALDDSTVAYTPASFAGKVVLVDFWATWCGPCVGEMPYLQAAYDSLARRGLQILSISLDTARSDVRKFRAGQWKMPWLQAIAPGNFSGEEAQKLEIMMIPRPFLIGRDGKVLATDDELRGDRLLPALRKALEAPAAPPAAPANP